MHTKYGAPIAFSVYDRQDDRFVGEKPMYPTEVLALKEIDRLDRVERVRDER